MSHAAGSGHWGFFASPPTSWCAVVSETSWESCWKQRPRNGTNGCYRRRAATELMPPLSRSRRLAPIPQVDRRVFTLQTLPACDP